MLPAAFVFRGSHHIAAKVEEGDMPDLAQHDLMLWFSQKKGYLYIENCSFVSGISQWPAKWAHQNVEMGKSQLNTTSALCVGVALV